MFTNKIMLLSCMRVKMSLCCFFGHELKPDGTAFTPVMPPMSSLVITQVCVTNSFPTGGPVTLYVQSHKMPTRVAVATLCPDQDVFHCSLQLIFSTQVSFTLEAHKVQKKIDGDSEKPAPFPHIHLSGYYERDDVDDDEEEESGDESEFVGGKGVVEVPSSRRGQKRSRDRK